MEHHTARDPDTEKPVAILLVGGYSGLGRHSLLTLLRMFPHHFSGVVFLSVAVVDSESFKGADQLAALEARTRQNLLCYEYYARSLGLPAASMFSVGTEVAVEIEKSAEQLSSRYPRALSFRPIDLRGRHILEPACCTTRPRSWSKSGCNAGHAHDRRASAHRSASPAAATRRCPRGLNAPFWRPKYALRRRRGALRHVLRGCPADGGGCRPSVARYELGVEAPSNVRVQALWHALLSFKFRFSEAACLAPLRGLPERARSCSAPLPIYQRRETDAPHESTVRP